jgi:ParB family transcriptional regulator, chromosome partitioning protein
MTEATVQAVQQIPVTQIVPNPRQPRRVFAEEQIRALAQSIGSQGVVQPIVVRPSPEGPGRYELIAGERRLRAIRLLGWLSAPALVRAISDEALLETALVENIQREPLSPIEEATAYRQLLEDHGYTQETLAHRVGKDRSTIANMVRLLALPEAVQNDLEAGRLTIGHARALLAIADAARQRHLHKVILGKGLSVRETEALVARERDHNVTRSGASHGSAERSGPVLDAKWQTVQDRMERKLQTKVTIDLNADKASGKVSIDFYDLDDFNRIYDMLKGR